MIFKDLIHQCSWETVRTWLLHYHVWPEEIEELDGYLKVFNELNNREPVSELNSEMASTEIHLSYVEDEFEDGLDQWPDVYGVDAEGEKWALEFSPWDEWLALPVSTQTLAHYEKPEIVAHCIWEMTFIGFDETTIQQFKEDLIARKEELDNMSEEELQKYTYSLDDLREEFRLDNSQE